MKKIIIQYNNVEEYSAAYKAYTEKGIPVSVFVGLNLALSIPAKSVSVTVEPMEVYTKMIIIQYNDEQEYSAAYKAYTEKGVSVAVFVGLELALSLPPESILLTVETKEEPEPVKPLTKQEATAFFAEFYYGEHHIPGEVLPFGVGFKVIDSSEFSTTDFKVERETPILILKRKLGDKLTVPCPFCGTAHQHGTGDGHRISHCANMSKLFVTAPDGTVLFKKDGYIVKTEKDEKEKDYEILTGVNSGGVHKWSDSASRIHSARRLSDGEVFTLYDFCQIGEECQLGSIMGFEESGTSLKVLFAAKGDWQWINGIGKSKTNDEVEMSGYQFNRSLSRPIYKAWDEQGKKMYTKFVDCQVLIDNFGELTVGIVENGDYRELKLLRCIRIKAIGDQLLYEGDIVKWDDRSSGKYWRVAVVRAEPDIQFEIIRNIFHPVSTKFPKIFHFGRFAYANSTQTELHKIGNIYENPEIVIHD